MEDKNQSDSKSEVTKPEASNSPAESPVVKSEPVVSSNANTNNTAANPVQKKSGNTIVTVLVVIGVLLLVCCAVVAGLFWYGGKKAQEAMYKYPAELRKDIPGGIENMPSSGNEMAAPKDFKEVALGQTAASETFELTVKGTEIKDGKAILTLAVKNKSAEPQTLSTLLMFRLDKFSNDAKTEGDTNMYFNDFFGEYTGNFDGEFAAGETREGTIGFDLNGDTVEVKDLYLEFVPGILSTEGFRMKLS